MIYIAIIIIIVLVVAIALAMYKGEFAYAVLAFGTVMLMLAYLDAKQDYKELQMECDYQGTGET